MTAAKRAAVLRSLSAGAKTALDVAADTQLMSNEVRRILRESPVFEIAGEVRVKQGKAKLWRLTDGKRTEETTGGHESISS